ncbi:MAG: response regulator [Bacteroidetes bacterium]|nr:response regulator [Bacteroidota bacterium]
MKKSVLLVDDSSIDTMINEKIISSLGLFKEVHRAENGEQALNIFNLYQTGTIEIPDIILLDLNMPVMDGFGFIQAFQSLKFPHKENVLIVIVTSSDDPSDIKLASKLGIKYFLTKPLTHESVQSIIQQEFKQAVA